MRKIILSAIIATFVFTSATMAYAKPAGNNAGAFKVYWNLSGEVMPVPPYGSGDIVNSDILSKLIVNQPNGSTQATITGEMNGLNPNTQYTVYLSKGYTKYTPATPINVVGTWKWLVLETYEHDLVITHENPDGTFVGTGGYPAGASTYDTSENITGQVVGNTISLTTTYNGPYNPGYTVTVTGTINPDGTMSGNSPWEWHTTAGHATAGTSSSGDTYWPGMFNNQQPFTFTTDSNGSGSWHINLTSADFVSTGIQNLSVWINGAVGTILISDPFQITAR